MNRVALLRRLCNIFVSCCTRSHAVAAMTSLKGLTTPRKGPSSRRPVPLYISDEKALPISIVINIRYHEEDLTLKLAICRCFTVAQAAALAAKRFNSILHRTTAEDAATFTLALPGKSKGDPPTLLSSTMKLTECRIADEDVLELHKEPAHVVVRVFVPHGRDKNTTLALRFPPSTPTYLVIEKLCQRFHALQLPHLDTYVLSVEEGFGGLFTPMSENEPISSYNLSNRLVFQSRGAPITSGLTLRVRVMEDGADTVGQQFIFDPNCSVLVALRKVKRLIPVPERVGLFIQRKENEFLRMKESLALREYGLNDGDIVCIRQLQYDYSVSLPDGTEDHFPLEPQRTVGELLELLRFNYPDDAPDEMALYCRGDAMQASDQLYSWESKDIPLVYKKEPKRISVAYMNNVEHFELDFSRPLQELSEFENLFYNFGISMPRLEEYQLSVGDAPDAPDRLLIDPTKSLDSQGMQPGVLIHLTMKPRKQRDILDREGPPPLLPSDTVSSTNSEDEALSKSENVRRSIWDEPESPSTVEWDRSTNPPVLVLGTINQLVCKLADESTHPDFLKAFFMTYRSFTTPRILLRKLIERYTIPPRVAKDEKVAKTVQLRVLNAIKTWVDKFWDLDSDTELATAALLFVENDVRKDQHVKLADMLSMAIQKRLNNLGDNEPSFKMHTLRRNAKKGVAATPRELVDCSEEDIANQLTLMEFAIYSSIQPSELLGQCWAKPQLHHRAPHVMDMVNRFNTVGNWVAKCIIEPLGLKSRVKRFEKMIATAKLLRERNNFSTMMAFLGGMNNAAVSRLKWTRASLSKKTAETLADLEGQMKSELSYKSYREIMRLVKPPAIPYIGVAMKDLTFIEDGNPDTVRGLVNFAKRRMLHRVISDTLAFQEKEYEIPPVAGIADLVATMPPIIEKDLYATSLQREPRDCEKSDLQP